MAIFANGLYYQFAERRIYRIKAREIQDESVEKYLIRDRGGTSKMGATIVTILAVASIFSAIFSRLIEILFKKFVQARYMNIRSFPLVNRLKIILEIGLGILSWHGRIRIGRVPRDSRICRRKRLRSNLLLIINWVRLSRTHL